MNQAVYYPTLRVELWEERIEEPPIAVFVTAPGGISDQVGQLNQTRSAGVDEQRHLGKVTKFPPTAAIEAKMSRQSLNGLFVFRVVHDNQTALIALPAIAIPRSTVSALQKKVKPIAQFFKRDLDRILRGYRGTIHGDREKLYAGLVTQQGQGLPQHLLPPRTVRDRFPNSAST